MSGPLAQHAGRSGVLLAECQRGYTIHKMNGKPQRVAVRYESADPVEEKERRRARREYVRMLTFGMVP